MTRRASTIAAEEMPSAHRVTTVAGGLSDVENGRGERETETHTGASTGGRGRPSPPAGWVLCSGLPRPRVARGDRGTARNNDPCHGAVRGRGPGADLKILAFTGWQQRPFVWQSALSHASCSLGRRCASMLPTPDQPLNDKIFKLAPGLMFHGPDTGTSPDTGPLPCGPTRRPLQLHQNGVLADWTRRPLTR